MNKELLYDSETGKLVSGNSDELFQNRDIIKWMDRIKRGEAFMDDAVKVMDIIHDVLNNAASKYFSGAWKAHYESHEEPDGLKIDSNMTAPTIRKEHKDGDEDKYFVYFKEYPFCYIFNLTDVFSIKPFDEKMAANEDYYKQFYLSEVAPDVELDLADIIDARIRREVGTDVFHVIRKANEQPTLDKININLATSFKLAVDGNGGASQQKMPGTAVDRAVVAGGGTMQTYLTSDDIKAAIAREISIAMGRLTPLEELEKKFGKDGNG